MAKSMTVYLLIRTLCIDGYECFKHTDYVSFTTLSVFKLI